jgi:hypothetical protein
MKRVFPEIPNCAFDKLLLTYAFAPAIQASVFTIKDRYYALLNYERYAINLN